MIYFDDLLRQTILFLLPFAWWALPFFAYSSLKRYRLYRPDVRPWFPLAVLLAWGSIFVGYFGLEAWRVVQHGPAALYSEKHWPNEDLYLGLFVVVSSALILILHFTVNPKRELFPRPKT